MPTYEEQQKLLRAQVPKGTAGAAELGRQGFTDVGIGRDLLARREPGQNPISPITGQSIGGILDVAPQTSGLTKISTQGVGPSGEPIFDVFSGQEHIQDPNDPRLKGVNIAGLPTGQAPENFQSKFQKGFNEATKQGIGEVDGAGQARAVVQKFAPATQSGVASNFIQADPVVGELFANWQEYIKPESQRKSLTETYKQMTKDSGVEALDMELVNMKNVIEGTEDDLRTEITKAGGFATESQVQALTNSRNKQLIKDYNKLIDTRNAKEKYLQTAIGLEQADRQSADQRFENMFNMGLQIADYQQKMQNNARTQMQWLGTNLGFDGLYDATGGDPYYMNLIEKTLGLPQGGLLSSADQARVARTQVAQEKELGLDLKRAELEGKPLERELKLEQIKTEKAQRAKIVADTQKIVSASEGTVFDMKTPGGKKQAALAKSKIDEIQGVLDSGSLKTAVGPNVFSRFGKIRNILRPSSANFIASVEQLRSQLNLQSLIDAKAQGATFGALSNQELRVLSNSATKLGVWAVGDKDSEGNITNVTGYKVKESDFKRELDKINNFAKLDYVYRGGAPEDVGVQVIDGKYYTKNSDGSITEL